jgi:RNA polymerase sigma factor (sigma-70 family)
MANDADVETRSTLLALLRQEPPNQVAWAEFVARYGPLIFRWCRRWGLQEADAEDVAQNVLLELSRQLREFVYHPGGSFRGWLRTIAYRCWCRFVDRRNALKRTHDGLQLERLCSQEAVEDFLHRLEQESDRELLEIAMARVKLRVQPRTWEAFRMTAVDDRPGAEVGAHLGMKVGAVFVARSKVQKMIREEIDRLDSGQAH